MAKYKRKNGITSVLYYIFSFLLLVAVVGMFSSFVVKDNTSSKKSFYIDYNGERLSTQSETLSLSFYEDLIFNVSFPDEVFDYSVKIVPYNDFNYKVNNSEKAYLSSIKEISSDYYSVELLDDSFVLRLKDFNVKTLLESYHGKSVFLNNDDVWGCHFALLVSAEGSKTYRIPFSLVSPVESVELGGSIVI